MPPTADVYSADFATRRSASRLDHPSDLLRRCENHRSSVTHHAGRRERGCTFFRTILTRVGLEAQVAFPEGACLVVGGGHAIGVAAIGDCLDPLVRLQIFQVGITSAAA